MVFACSGLLLVVVTGPFVAAIVLLAWGIGLAAHGFFFVAAPLLRTRWTADIRVRAAHRVLESRQELGGRHTRSLEVLSASVAHEIRNPITAARSLVAQIGEDPASPENAEYARVAVAELDRVERSISHLLRFARDEEVVVSEITLADVLEASLPVFEARIAKGGVQVVRQMDSFGAVRADPEKLRRVLANLIGNALDAFEEGSTPAPRLELSLGDNLAGTEVWLRVRDNGPGIAPERLAKIFTPFHTSRRAGTGLGLALSKKVVEAHGGTLEVKSQLGAGTDMTVVLPRGSRLLTARVLVVEDEPAIQLALAGLLRRLGHEVEQARGGQEAIARLRDGAFDMVITDLSLGGAETGLDVLRAAKEGRAELPVVMITAHGSEKIAVEAMKAGAEDYLPKPFDNDAMRLVVTRALDRTRLAREHRLLLERVAREYGLGAMVGAGPGMRRVFEQARKVAETDLTVLVRGESGTGKELVAQALHEGSPRAGRPFVAVNCAAISRELVESELFGHEKGAFTGASASDARRSLRGRRRRDALPRRDRRHAPRDAGQGASRPAGTGVRAGRRKQDGQDRRTGRRRDPPRPTSEAEVARGALPGGLYYYRLRVHRDQWFRPCATASRTFPRSWHGFSSSSPLASGGSRSP